MSISSRRGCEHGPTLSRILLAALIAAAISACETTSPTPPSRPGLPGEQPTQELDLPPVPVPDPVADALPDLADASLFEATRRAIEAGDWMAARLALPRPAPVQKNDLDDRLIETGDAPPGPDVPDRAIPASDTATSAWIRYYQARIDLMRGDREQHATTLASLSQAPLPPELRREINRHELHLAVLAGNRERQINAIATLLPQASEESERSGLEQQLWRALQAMPVAQRTKAGRHHPGLTPWQELADATSLPDAGASATAIGEWLQRYPEHRAAARATLLRDAALRDAQTQRLALMLPLSGPLQDASDVVSDGFLAAAFEAGATMEVQVLDSRRFHTPAEAYDAAQATGADVIVGPLGKRQVGQLLAREQRSTPLLTLNRPEIDQPAHGALQLSLAPEDEAEQLAELAWSRGARRVLLIRPDSSWGQRMDTALRERFRALGGELPVTARYRDAAGYSDTIRDALALGASNTRSREVRALFAARVETQGRRREDLDAIFLLPRSSGEARALKPLIDYHFAGDLPVYAPSTADTGRNDPAVNRDLAGLQLLARPGRLAPEAVPGTQGTDTPPGALYDLGADAFTLAQRWWRMNSGAGTSHAGLTGRVEAGAAGTLYRELRLAEFDRGVLRPL